MVFRVCFEEGEIVKGQMKPGMELMQWVVGVSWNQKPIVCHLY